VRKHALVVVAAVEYSKPLDGYTAVVVVAAGTYTEVFESLEALMEQRQGLRHAEVPTLLPGIEDSQ
jgi:hypothetical protein